jgi:pilus assembly protein CpaC
MNHQSTALQVALRSALITLATGAFVPLATAAEVQRPMAPCSDVDLAPAQLISVGKTVIYRPKGRIDRVLLGNPEGSRAGRPGETSGKEDKEGKGSDSTRPGVGAVDVVLISKSEVFLVGKSIGSSNVVLHHEDGRCTAFDVAVSMDIASLQGTINRLLPNEKDIQIQAAYDSIVLTGSVSGPGAITQVLELTNAYVRGSSGGSSGASIVGANPRIVNMLSTGAPQQVMLEVKVAEVSKTLMNKLGVRTAANRAGVDSVAGIDLVPNLIADFATNSKGQIGAVKRTTNWLLGIDIDAHKDDGLVKILAEPTIMAISGKEGRFNAGGKIFVPVAQSSASGAGSITLEEKPFGVSVAFVPTVLDGGRINLEVATEVSELNRGGTTIGGTVIPSFSSRSAKTTVQLMDGQSFVIGGLIKNNASTNIEAIPGIGEVPVLGALFRSTDFQTDQSELVFVITPRLAKPLDAGYKLPTDNYVAPTRGEVQLLGKTEGQK